jgi:hypothetical protein
VVAPSETIHLLTSSKSSNRATKSGANEKDWMTSPERRETGTRLLALYPVNGAMSSVRKEWLKEEVSRTE